MKAWPDGEGTPHGPQDREEGPMDRTTSNEGLSHWYRFGWRVRYILLNVFGPAQLGDDNDPSTALRRERQARVDRARQSHP
jgi:hypothetical protein